MKTGVDQVAKILNGLAGAIMTMIAFGVIAFLVILASVAVFGVTRAEAQEPDRRGEVWTDELQFKGDRPNAPMPPRFHMQNEGGSDGAGLCVISSICANGMYQGVPGLFNPPGGEAKVGNGAKGSELWKAAKRAPGGYSPDKLGRLVDRVMPAEKYASYYGRDTGVLHKLSAQGYPIGATMNTGKLYNYAGIHHMISLISYKTGGYAWVVDNNRPGHYSVMPSSEFDRRWFDGGYGWAWVWTRLPASVKRTVSLAGPLALLAAALLAVYSRQKQESRSMPAGA